MKETDMSNLIEYALEFNSDPDIFDSFEEFLSAKGVFITPEQEEELMKYLDENEE